MFTRATKDGYAPMLDGVTMKTLAHGERTVLTEVHLAKGAMVPMHDHEQEQTGTLLSGALRFTVGEESFDAGPGDAWNLAAGIPHGAEALEDTVVIEVFSPLRPELIPGD